MSKSGERTVGLVTWLSRLFTGNSTRKLEKEVIAAEKSFNKTAAAGGDIKQAQTRVDVAKNNLDIRQRTDANPGWGPQGLAKRFDRATTGSAGRAAVTGAVGYGAKEYKFGGLISNKISGAQETLEDLKKLKEKADNFTKSPWNALREYFDVAKGSGTPADIALTFAEDNASLLAGTLGSLFAWRMTSNVWGLGTLTKWLSIGLSAWLCMKGVAAACFKSAAGEEFKPGDPTNGVRTDLSLPVQPEPTPPPYSPPPAPAMG